MKTRKRVPKIRYIKKTSERARKYKKSRHRAKNKRGLAGAPGAEHAAPFQPIFHGDDSVGRDSLHRHEKEDAQIHIDYLEELLTGLERHGLDDREAGRRTKAALERLILEHKMKLIGANAPAAGGRY